MIRREAFEAVGGFETDFPRCVDRDMCIRLANEYRFAFVDELLIERLIHGKNISHEPEQADVNAMITEKHATEIRQYPAVKRTLYARWHQMRGAVARQSGDRVEALRYHWAALRHQSNPLSPRPVDSKATGHRPVVVYPFSVLGTDSRSIQVILTACIDANAVASTERSKIPLIYPRPFALRVAVSTGSSRNSPQVGPDETGSGPFRSSPVHVQAASTNDE